MASIWTEDRTTSVRAMWERGVSGKAIAAIISDELQIAVSRNAVIGKAHRDGWLTPNSPTVRSWIPNVAPRAPAPKRLPRPRLSVVPTEYTQPAPIEPSLPQVQTRPGGVTLAEMGPDDCRFPIGDPRDPGFHHCGAPRRPDLDQRWQPYCYHHHKISHMEERRGQKSTHKVYVPGRRIYG